MTNEEHVRKSLTTRELAVLLLHSYIEDDWDEGMDGEMYICGEHDVYQTSDHQEFTDYDEAVEHEVWWLQQEVTPNG